MRCGLADEVLRNLQPRVSPREYVVAYFQDLHILLHFLIGRGSRSQTT